MKLISCTDFVLEFGKETNRDNYEQAYDKISAYAKLLKQPLTLGIFVPCDLEGNVLEEPEMFQDYLLKNEEYSKLPHVHCNEWHKSCEQYQESKNRVIFDNFKFKKETENSYWLVEDGSFSYFIDKGLNQDIECIIHKEFMLTESAKKQILGS